MTMPLVHRGSTAYTVFMTNDELLRALAHCHSALGESLGVIADLLEKRSDPEDVIRRIEIAEKKYHTIGRLFEEQDPS